MPASDLILFDRSFLPQWSLNGLEGSSHAPNSGWPALGWRKARGESRDQVAILSFGLPLMESHSPVIGLGQVALKPQIKRLVQSADRPRGWAGEYATHAVSQRGSDP